MPKKAASSTVTVSHTTTAGKFFFSPLPFSPSHTMSFWGFLSYFWFTFMICIVLCIFSFDTYFSVFFSYTFLQSLPHSNTLFLKLIIKQGKLSFCFLIFFIYRYIWCPWGSHTNEWVHWVAKLWEDYEMPQSHQLWKDSMQSW